MKRMNFPGRKEVRRKEALQRIQEQINKGHNKKHDRPYTETELKRKQKEIDNLKAKL